MKIPTVNVIEVADSVLMQIISFKDGKKGNKEAEAIFTKIALENGAKKCDMESYLEEGIFSESTGSYGVYITHSN